MSESTPENDVAPVPSERANSRLIESEQRLAAILDAAVDAIVTIDRRCIITGVNAATERMFGYTAGEMIGKNVNMLMPSPYHEQHDGYIARYLATGEARIIGIGREVRARRKDGSLFPVDLAVSDIPSLGLFTGIIRDITERKQMERHLMEIRESERQRIGRELHDGLGAHLTGISMLAQSLRLSLQREKSPLADRAEQVVNQVREAHQQLRRISHGLTPVEFISGGLPHALQTLADTYDNSDSFTCRFEGDPSIEIKDPFAITELYRIAQEAVSNAARHAQADEIVISLEATADKITLCVRDDGVGIRGKTDSRRGLGLRTMKHRADMIDALLIVGPGERAGTLVQCVLSNPSPTAIGPKPRIPE